MNEPRTAEHASAASATRETLKESTAHNDGAEATMNRAFLAAAVLAITTVVGHTPVEAQQRQITEEQREQLEQRLEEFRTRLNLSEDHRAQLEPVLHFEQRAEVLRRYGVGRDRSERLSLRQARALRNDLEEVGRESTTVTCAPPLPVS